MFWGVTLESGKRYSQVVDASFHITMAALEPPTKELPKSAKNVSVLIEHGKVEFLLCTLQYDRVMQVRLDLLFVEGEEVSFFLNGEGTVHLTGYVLDDDTMDDTKDESGSSEASDEDVDEEGDESDESIDESFVQKLAKVSEKDEAESDDEWIPGKKRKKPASEGVSPVAKEPKKKKTSTPNQGVEIVESKSVALPETPVSLQEVSDSSDDSDEHFEDAESEDSDEDKEEETDHDDEADEQDDDSDVSDEDDDDSSMDEDTSEDEEEEDDDESSAKKSPLQLSKKKGKGDLNVFGKSPDKQSKGEAKKELLSKKKKENLSQNMKNQNNTSPSKSAQKKGDMLGSAKKGSMNSGGQQLFVRGTKNENARNESNRSSPKKENKSKSESPSKMESQQTPNEKKKSPKAEAKLMQSGGQKGNKNEAQAKNSNSAKKNSKLQNGTPQAVTPKSLPVSTPNSNARNDKTPTKVKKALPGGVMIEDYIVGSGPMARKGRFAHVYYSGKLTNNVQFDSVLSGKPFSFRLGMGEVIKGWDQGIEGMRVGGKRKIVVPPSLGYGKKSVGPIPSNSTLYFDVELRAVS